MPVWLAVELALTPLFVGGLVWLVRLEGKVRHNRADIERIEKEKKERATTQSDHNDRIYDLIRKLDGNINRIMGKLGIEPVE